MKLRYISILLALLLSAPANAEKPLRASQGKQVKQSVSAPVFTTGTIASVEENTTAVMTVNAMDADGDRVSYSLTGGADDALFTISKRSGTLTFKNAPDYEAPSDNGNDNTYDIQVTASDGSLSTNQSIVVMVTDINEYSNNAAPVFTSSAMASVAESTLDVMTVNATDADGDSVSYSLTGNVDDALFSINASSGALRFKSAPSYSAPTDSGADNIYNIQVAASDGTQATSQNITVTVTQVTANALADAINQYRIDHGLPAIPVSVSLNMVSEAHVGDLENNLPTGQCNLHSWSDQGPWTPCCYTDDHSQAQCMYDKPREITGNLYNSNGYEIATWYYFGMTVEEAISAWEASPGHLDVILNRNGWSGVTWNAMGAAMLGNSAVVWFGTIPDPAGSP